MTTEQRIEKILQMDQSREDGDHATRDMVRQLVMIVRNQQKQIDSLMTVEKDRLDKLVQQEEASNYNPAD
jgi:hypothetical protein